jgi:aminoglycoside phosphotransferase (APT) family kinase protein
MAEPKTSGEDLEQGLAAFIARNVDATSVRIEGLRRLTGGASRETWSLDALLKRGGAVERVPLILQRDTPGPPKQVPRSLEYRVFEAARAAGVPAPEPYLMGDASLGGGEFFLVRRVDGENIPRRLLREEAYAAARSALPSQLGAALAKIHAVPAGQPGFERLVRPPDGEQTAAWTLDRHEQTYRTIALEAHPAFELAFRWLKQHLRVAAPPAGYNDRVLVHGDFRMGNVMFDERGLQAVLDWEITHIGDPAEDLAWVCVRSWRFGGKQPVAGIGTREEFFAAYEAAGGAPVGPAWVHFWEVFGNLRWGVICLSQARVYLDGYSKSVELASIGRRTSETEWELLGLIG